MSPQPTNISIIDFLHRLPAMQRDALLRSWQQDPALYGAAEEGFAAKMNAIASGDRDGLDKILKFERTAAEEFINALKLETARLQLEAS